MASTRPATSAKKRKIDDPAAPPKKKSPLADLPQNYYAPPVDMTRDELSTWRKEQRRERNRQSAAASRQQTKKRIEELEGEVFKYKSQCEEMKSVMAGMERKIHELMKLNGMNLEETVVCAPHVEQATVTPPGSYPNSPSRSPDPESSPQDFSSHFPPFPDFAPSYPLMFNPYPTLPSAPGPAPVASHDASLWNALQSKEHLKPISRQA